MANKLSDILEQESSGIMFPFRTGVKSVKTEQQVYTPTDGIMNVKGEAYAGPNAVITYGTEEQGFPRQLKEIEKGMLPRFDQTQFPDIGKGKIETTRPGIPTTPPPTTEPDKPIMDPCPPGFKLDPVKKICVPIQQPKGDDKKIGPTNPPRNIGPAANAVSKVADAIKKQGGLYKDGQFKEIVTLEIDNSSILANFGFLGKFIDDVFIKGPADKKFIDTFGGGKDSPYSTEELEGIAVIKGKDGKLKATFNQKGKQNFDNIATGESLKGNLASTQKKDDKGNIIIAPNGQPMIVAPIRVNPFGTTGGTAAPKKKMDTRNFAERRALLMRDRTKKPTTGTTKPGTKSAPKKTGSSGTSGPPKGTRFSNLSRTKTTKTGGGSSKAFSARGINRPGF
jgi:hypothetical protein